MPAQLVSCACLFALLPASYLYLFRPAWRRLRPQDGPCFMPSRFAPAGPYTGSGEHPCGHLVPADMHPFHLRPYATPVGLTCSPHCPQDGVWSQARQVLFGGTASRRVHPSTSTCLEPDPAGATCGGHTLGIHMSCHHGAGHHHPVNALFGMTRYVPVGHSGSEVVCVCWT